MIQLRYIFIDFNCDRNLVLEIYYLSILLLLFLSALLFRFSLILYGIFSNSSRP